MVVKRTAMGKRLQFFFAMFSTSDACTCDLKKGSNIFLLLLDLEFCENFEFFFLSFNLIGEYTISERNNPKGWTLDTIYELA